MTPQELKSVQKAAGQIETALGVFEGILEETNNSFLYKSSLSLIEALRRLHEVDPELLTADNRTRMEELNQRERPKTGRDSFNTGF